MHGRNRHDYKRHQRDADTAAAWAHKAEKWYALEAALHQARQPLNGTTTTTTTTTTNEPQHEHHCITLELTRKALTVHPEPLYLWNQRRELLLSLLQDCTSMNEQQKPLLLFSLETELELTQTALQNNPKAYGAWWHRKWSVRQALGCLRLSDSTDPLIIIINNNNNNMTHRILQQELALTTLFLQRDERNFHGWNYRRFIVSCQLLASCAETRDPVHGRTTMAGADGSWNIACWNGEDNNNEDDDATDKDHTTTLWMGAQLTSSLDDESLATTCNVSSPAVQAILPQEWEFTTQKIQDNFSNYSAFHYRSKLVPLMLRVRAMQQQQRHQTTSTAEPRGDDAATAVLSPRQLLFQQELQLAEQAMFTEPDDQTAWWYQRFLLDYFGKAMTPSSSSSEEEEANEWMAIVHAHRDNLQELAAEVPRSKWVWLGLWNILEFTCRATAAKKTMDGGGGGTRLEQQRRAILQTLLELDDDRRQRYLYLLEQLDEKDD